MMQALFRRLITAAALLAATAPLRAVTLAALSGGMELTCQFVNNSGVPDNQVYIAVIARDASNTVCYLNAAGALIPVAGGQNVSMYSMTLSSFTALQFPPVMTSGRLWISYNAPMNMATFAGGGIAQPNLANPSDPNINTVFDWMEFNVGGGQIYCNTTQVDQFGIPYTVELYDDGPVLNSKRGIDACYSDIQSQYLAFMAATPGAAPFASLAGSARIVAPSHGSFAAGQPNAGYFDAYIASVWAGPYRPAGVAQPSTQDVFAATGPLATQAAVDGALNRHVADNAGGYNVSSAFYQNAPANFYADFWHQVNLGGYAYGFAYDDSDNQSSLQVSSHPRALVINLSGCVPTPTPSFTRTSTPPPPPSPSATPTITRTATASVTASASPSASATRTASASATPSATATATLTPSVSASATRSLTPSASASATATRSATPSASATATRSVTPSASPSATASASATLSVTSSATATRTVTVSPSASVTPSRSMTASATSTESATASRTLTGMPSASASPSPSSSPSFTATATATGTAVIAASSTPTPSATASPRTAAASPSASPSAVLGTFFQQGRLIEVRGLYPIPFVDTMHLYFTLRVDARIDLQVYDVAGEPVWHLQAPGRAGKALLDWEGINELGGRCAAGVYVLRLRAQGVDGTTDEIWERAAISR
jgi:hypothetical protein